MSLQRIFESARKLGVPVIITDSQGREPLVVLPLEQFEAMAGEEQDGRRKVENAGGHVMRPERVALRSETSSSDTVEPQLSVIEGDEKQDISKNIQLEMISGLEGGSTEISLEERFYLEPIEDKESG